MTCDICDSGGGGGVVCLESRQCSLVDSWMPMHLTVTVAANCQSESNLFIVSCRDCRAARWMHADRLARKQIGQCLARKTFSVQQVYIGRKVEKLYLCTFV